MTTINSVAGDGEAPNPWRIRRYVILSYCTLVVWPILLFVSMFVFDAPGSEKRPLLWVIEGFFWGFGLFPVLTHLLARLLERRKQPRLAACIALAPALIVMVGVIWFFTTPV